MIRKVGWGFGRCNQFCRHCYNASTCHAPAHGLDVLKRIADKICPSITDINYGTGEFIVNPNALELAEYVDERYPHVVQAVTSNGYTVIRLGPERVGKLFHDVDISLDFPSAERHNGFRGHAKAWDWAVGALRVLREAGVPRTLVTCVTSLTTDDDILRLLDLSAEFGAYWRINWFRQVGRGDPSLRIGAARAWDIVRMLSGRARFVCLDSVFGGVLGFGCTPCTAGHHTCRIHEGLKVSPYPYLKGEQWDCGNIADPETDLGAVYRSAPFEALRARKPRICSDCPFFDTCRGGCASRAALHVGRDGADDYCPVAAGLDIGSLREIELVRAEDATLVHDGYLCTTIVEAGKGGCHV